MSTKHLIIGFTSTAITDGSMEIDFSDEDAFRKFLEENASNSLWRYSVKAEVLKTKLNSNYDLHVSIILGLELGERSRSGHLFALTVRYEDTKGEIKKFKLDDSLKIRSALHESYLPSTAFVYSKVVERNGEFVYCDIIGAGWDSGTDGTVEK